MLELQKFIKTHENWKKLLSEAPYYINVSEYSVFDRNLIIFRYTQGKTDFSNVVSRECRGVILDRDTFDPVCVPFFKFGNYGESYIPEIDWNSAYTTEKIDGSLYKIVNLNGNILVSTNNVIDSRTVKVQEQIGFSEKTFYDLALSAFSSSLNRNLSSFEECADLFKEGYTYMFEIVSPYNKVVLDYSETKAYFIGVRNNLTLKEEKFFEHPLGKIFPVPALYDLNSMEKCIQAAEALTGKEGFVVMDKNFNRIKIKSPEYIKAHYLRQNRVFTGEAAVNIIRSGETEEFLTYNRESEKVFEEIKKLYFETREEFSKIWRSLALDSISRKEAAAEIQKTMKDFSFMGFMMLNGKYSTPEECFDSIPADRIYQKIKERKNDKFC